MQTALDVYAFRNHIKYPVSCFHMPLAHYCRTLEDSIFDYRCPVLTLPAYCRGVDCTSPSLEQELRQQTGLIDHKEHSLSNSKNCRIELQERDIRISMDGKGRALDNIFVERLWRSVKHEWLYLHEFQTVPELDAGLNEYST